MKVIIFAERKQDVDAIHEYLLLKGVDAVSIHGGKDQEERVAAVKMFRERQRDVLVATDVASKGLDFPEIMHVINYDMPEDIENYGTYLSFFCVVLLLHEQKQMDSNDAYSSVGLHGEPSASVPSASFRVGFVIRLHLKGRVP